jgi:LytS/YehU family sensor histidine kinase
MLYQTSDKYIALKEDVGILEKYAELEKLRHDDRFDFKFEYELENPDYPVEPLLMMPLMENAMKHCVNPDGKSFVHIKIVQKGDELSFVSENSNFPRKAKPNASGLGLSTFKKRLELMYSGRYQYDARVEGDVYRAELKVILKRDAV